MSDTPITDAFLRTDGVRLGQIRNSVDWSVIPTPKESKLIDFARQLERELAEARKEIERYEKDALMGKLLPDAGMEELARRLAECEKRAFALASNQCHKPIARENGDHGCEYQDAEKKARNEALEQARQWCLDNAEDSLIDIYDCAHAIGAMKEER